MGSIQSQHGLRSQNANRMLTLFRKICFDGKNPQSLVPTVKTPETPVKSRVSGVLKGAEKRSKCSKRHPLPRTRNQFAGNRTRVRIPPAAPCRSKRHIACSDIFYVCGKKRCHPPAPSLLLSKPDPLTRKGHAASVRRRSRQRLPLRWAAVCFFCAVLRHMHLFCGGTIFKAAPPSVLNCPRPARFNIDTPEQIV